MPTEAGFELPPDTHAGDLLVAKLGPEAKAPPGWTYSAELGGWWHIAGPND